MPKGIYARKVLVPSCHPEREYRAKGLCRNCYENTQHEAKSKRSAKHWEKNKVELYRRKQNGRLIKIGWTQESVEEKKKEQQNKCALCNEEFIKTPHADHKHSVPPVPRGLLCSTCNTALGLFKDDPTILRIAANYIEKYKTQN